MQKYYYKVTDIHSCSIYTKGKYNLHYTKGKIVEADPNSFGIMVFDSMSNVYSFLKEHILTDSKHLEYRKFQKTPIQRVLVYKVIGIGKKSTPKYISSYITEDKLNEYYNNKNNKNLPVISTTSGTVCFQKVHVLEKY